MPERFAQALLGIFKLIIDRQIAIDAIGRHTAADLFGVVVADTALDYHAVTDEA